LKAELPSLFGVFILDFTQKNHDIFAGGGSWNMGGLAELSLGGFMVA
jgi:hypothetical protein